MAQSNTLRQALIKTEYEPVSSSRKLQLLLQRSVRYSYRQRCCNCIPTILCELLFPILIIIILILARYGINLLGAEINSHDDRIPGTLGQRPCSQNLNIPQLHQTRYLLNVLNSHLVIKWSLRINRYK